MKLFKTPVLFAFFAVLVSFTAMASLGDPVSAGGKTISTATPAPQAKTNDTDIRAMEAEEKSADEAYYANWYIGIGGLILTLAMLVAAIVAAIYARASAKAGKHSARAAILSAKAAQKSVRDNEKYNKIQSRAYIGVSVTVKKFIFGENSTLCINSKNHGNTTAHNIETKFWHILTESTPDNLDYDKFTYRKKSNGTLFPNQSVYDVDIFNSEITEDDYKKITSQEKYFYSFGIVEYDDSFGDHQYTEFCAYINPNELIRGEGPLNSTDKHNTAT